MRRVVLWARGGAGGKTAAPPIAPAAAAILKATKMRRALVMPAVILVAGGVPVGILAAAIAKVTAKMRF